jgi:glycosyltransferase involved in cell wall biosynthesis
MSKIPAYVLITPARNEAQFIELTILSVVQQTIRPLKWVIVSDGSTDGTDNIVSKYTARHNWIELLTLPERAQRNFAGKAGAVMAGYARVAGLEYAVVGNLDADTTFDPDYLEFLLQKFAENPRLGVAGTPYREENATHDDRLKSRLDVSGACQMFRRECFEAIGGYSPIHSGGIDLIAVLQARAKGWETRRFDEKTCLHHRNVGSGNEQNVLRRLLKRGRKDYLLGGDPFFEIFRSTYQMKSRPYVVGGLLMFAGYMWAMLRGERRTMPEDLIEIRRNDQMQRLTQFLRHPLRFKAG